MVSVFLRRRSWTSQVRFLKYLSDNHHVRFLDRLERNYGRWAIPNVTVGIILGQVFLYGIAYFNIRPEMLFNCLLIPSKVLDGEVWRVATFIIIPPNTNPLFALIAWSLLYFMGTSLENHWGTLRYNLFLLIGMVSTVCAAFVANYYLPGIPGSNLILLSTIFLAFAMRFPEVEINVMFLIPVKVRWLALFQWCVLGWKFVQGPGILRLMIAAALLNFFLFFGRDILDRIRVSRRRLSGRVQEAKAKRTPRHVCRVCGVTNLSDPKMRFRYCSMCEGPCAYCTEHIHDHEHVIAGAEPSQQ